MSRQKPIISLQERLAIVRGDLEFTAHDKDCGDYIMRTTNVGERLIKKEVER